MVQNTVHATYTETYDLNTALNEISLLGIHTPQAAALKQMFKGFFENYKKYKIVGCDIGMVCASQQSLTPDQIGLSGGVVDPRDVLNPILFKACTGEHLNEILNIIYNDFPSTSGSSVNQAHSSSTIAINSYYQMLSDDTWRKEHPQRGLFVKGLKPLVHKIVTTQPFRWTGSSSTEATDFPSMVANAPSTDVPTRFGGPKGLSLASYNVNTQNDTVFISDGTTDMPWLDTVYDGTIKIGENDYRSANLIVSVPRVFCGCIILPPAILQRLFFRMQIQWHVMFKDFRPAFEVGPISGSYLADTADLASAVLQAEGTSLLGDQSPFEHTYWNIYHDASTKLEKEFSSFDVNGEAEVEQVMQSAQ